MAVIDLSTRLSTDWGLFNKCKVSSDSYIYISERGDDGTINPTSMDLLVGDKCLNPKKNEEFYISDVGLYVEPKESLIIYTKRKFAMPYNIFGVVTGKGNLIFQGGFISSGKINPGFNGYLKIGFYNGSGETLLLKKGTTFASVYFLTMESELSYPYENYQQGPNPKKIKLRGRRKFYNWFKNNWQLGIPIVLSFIAILISIFLNGS